MKGRVLQASNGAKEQLAATIPLPRLTDEQRTIPLPRPKNQTVSKTETPLTRLLQHEWANPMGML